MKFSVLISVYAKENPSYLDQALESIYCQTLPPNELVLVKDGSLTTELDNVILSWKQKFGKELTIVSLEKNVGLAIALNQGLMYCKHDWIARMDSDDIAHTQRFEKQVKFLNQNPNIISLGGWIAEFNENPGDLKSVRRVPETHQEIVSFARFRNPMNHMTVFFNKKAVLDVGSYQYFPLLEDQYLWFRLIQQGYKFANLQEILVHARIGNNMVGRRRGWDYFINEIRLFREFKKMKFIGVGIFAYNITIRFFLRLIPINFLKQFYKIFLR